MPDNSRWVARMGASTTDWNRPSCPPFTTWASLPSKALPTFFRWAPALRRSWPISSTFSMLFRVSAAKPLMPSWTASNAFFTPSADTAPSNADTPISLKLRTASAAHWVIFSHRPVSLSRTARAFSSSADTAFSMCSRTDGLFSRASCSLTSCNSAKTASNCRFMPSMYHMSCDRSDACPCLLFSSSSFMNCWTASCPCKGSIIYHPSFVRSSGRVVSSRYSSVSLGKWSTKGMMTFPKNKSPSPGPLLVT